eukprot:gene5461-194_t
MQDNKVQQDKQLHCWYDKRGKCKNGDSCNFIHTSTTQEGSKEPQAQRRPLLDKSKANGVRWMTKEQVTNQHGQEEGDRMWKAATQALVECGIVCEGNKSDKAAQVQRKGMAKQLMDELRKEKVMISAKDPAEGENTHYVTLQARVETDDHTYIGQVRTKLRELAAHAGSVVCPEGWWRSEKGAFEMAVTAHKKKLEDLTNLLERGKDKLKEYGAFDSDGTQHMMMPNEQHTDRKEKHEELQQVLERIEAARLQAVKELDEALEGKLPVSKQQQLDCVWHALYNALAPFVSVSQRPTREDMDKESRRLEHTRNLKPNTLSTSEGAYRYEVMQNVTAEIGYMRFRWAMQTEEDEDKYWTALDVRGQPMSAVVHTGPKTGKILGHALAIRPDMKGGMEKVDSLNSRRLT